MLSKLRAVVLAAGIVGVALVVGLAAAGALDPGGLRPASSGSTPRPSREASAEPRTAKPTSGFGSPTGDVAVLVGAGDLADCARSQDELTADLVESIPGIVFTVGDHADPDGTPQQFEECYGPSWGRPSIKERTRPAAGDNDYDTADAAGYFGFFGAAAGDPGEGYYAYDAGTWRVYVLNSNCANVGGCGEDSRQAAWLRQDLEAEPRRCVVAIWHNPYFTSGPSEGGDASVRSFWRILQEAGAELVLNGHDHHYERFAPQTATGTPDPDGIVQFIVGTGGSRPDDLLTTAPNSEVRAFDVFGVLRLELAPDGYAAEFIGVAGRDFRDRSSGKCH